MPLLMKADKKVVDICEEVFVELRSAITKYNRDEKLNAKETLIFDRALQEGYLRRDFEGAFCLRNDAGEVISCGDKRNKAMYMLAALTPGGSEFYNDPQYCVDYIRKRMSVEHEVLIKFKLKADGKHCCLGAKCKLAGTDEKTKTEVA